MLVILKLIMQWLLEEITIAQLSRPMIANN
jgi:hypothetical protein